MLLKIRHQTTYSYAEPVFYALQQLRLTPKTTATQVVRSWETTVTGGRKQLSFSDMHRNTVELISFDPGATQVTVLCQGEVEVRDSAGVQGEHGGFMPLWMFNRSTPATKAGPLVRKLLATVGDTPGTLSWLHALSTAIHAQVAYETGVSAVTWTAEDTLAAGHGVCQDHAHIFLACARAAGVPCRYVSGYLLMDDRIDQEATHAWAEAHVPDLGWVGFDISNAISPDTRYVKIATGLDYAEAAPVSGTRFGSGAESLTVQLQVAQQ